MHQVATTELLPHWTSFTTPIVFEANQQIPGSVQYAIKRFAKPDGWMGDEVGQMRYHVEEGRTGKNFLELRFCLIGNMYCRKYQNECNQCKEHLSALCNEKIATVDFISFQFSATHLEQFLKWRIENNSLSERLLSFKHTTSFTRTIPLCHRTRNVMEGLLNHSYSDSLENIFVNAQTQMLLLYSLDCMDDKELDVINCKFLSNEADRGKVMKAREVLLQHIGEPITIKQLSRKVAMNECYLKKGFKEMFGTTIFDFYQSQRMEHARYLLYEKGLSVTEVSMLLGYSSISHFSTAFKKHTGLKPCELLLR